MGGKNDSPDYTGAAIQQGEANREVTRDQTYANRPDQYTPWGSTSWGQNQQVDPATGESVTGWDQTTRLTPELQNILNMQTGVQAGRSAMAGRLIGRAQDEFSQPMNWGALSPMGERPWEQYTAAEPDVGNPYGTRARAENAMLNQAHSRLAPQFDNRRQSLEIKLRNQGLRPGDESYRTQMEGLALQENDAYNQANWSAVDAGRRESGQMFGQLMDRNQNTFGQNLQSNQQNYGQAMQGSQYANQLRQQQMAEAMTQRGFSLNEVNALLSGQQVGMPQMPNFSQAQSAQPAPYYQAAADQGSYDAAMDPFNGLMGLTGTLGGAYLGNR